MSRVVIGGDRSIPGSDPATVWALVADPSRLAEWTPLVVVGYMGRELPDAGAVFFAKGRRRRPDREALRYEYVEWVAGRSYRCAMPDGVLGQERELEVRVHAVLEDDGAHTTVQLIHRAEVARWGAAAYRVLATRRIRRALEAILRAGSGP